MEITFLGTGTSHGIPVILCNCGTCLSPNPKNKRLRSSVFIKTKGRHILIDASIDFRQQCLQNRIDRIDAVFFTHHHVDHIFGLDDTRAYGRTQKTRMPCYGRKDTIDSLKQVYKYIFDYPDIPGGIPMVDFIELNGPTEIGDVTVRPIEIRHGRLPINAYRIDDFAYATDCSQIPESSWKEFEGTDTLVLDCLRLRPHPTHFHLEQALEAAHRIGARRTYFTHMSHEIEHERVSASLPDGIFLAYDGLTLECPDSR